MVHDGSLDGALVMTDVRAHELPHLVLASGWLTEFGTVEGVGSGLLLIVPSLVFSLHEVES